MAPLAILAIWGYSYLRSVYEILKAPGVPVELKYTSESGKIGRVRAESYTLDLARGNVYLTRLSFMSEDGDSLAKLGQLRLTGLQALYGADQVVHADGVDLDARLVRLANGRFELEDFLPKQQKEKTKIPFEVAISNVRVRLIDRAGHPWSTTMSSRLISVAGISDDWVAHTSGSVAGLGTIDAQIQNVVDFGINVTANSPRLQVAGLLNHLATTRDLKTLPDIQTASVRSAIVHGPFRVFIPRERSFRTESTLVAQLAGVRYKEYTLERAQFQGLISELGAVGKLSVRDGANRADLSGSMRWDKTQRMAGTVNVQSPSPAAIPSWARTYLPAKTDFQNGKFAGWLSYAPSSGIRLSGDVNAASATYQGQTLVAPRARLSYGGNYVLLRLKSGAYQGHPASGVFAYSVKDQALSGALDKVNIDLRDLSRFGIKGLTGHALVTSALGGTLREPIVAFQATGSGTYLFQGHRVDLGQFRAAGLYNKGSFNLQRAIVSSPNTGLLIASGTMDAQGHVKGDVIGRGIRAGAFYAGARGRGNLLAHVTGTLKNPQVSGRVEAYALRINEELIPAAEANFSAELNGLRVSQFQAVRGSGVVSGSGRYTFKNQAIFADVKGENIQVAELLGPEFVGAIQVPALEISGTLKKPMINGAIRGENLLVRNVKIDSLSGRARTVGDTVRLQDAFAKVAGGTVTADASYNLKSKSGIAKLTASDLDLERLLPEFSPYVGTKGHVAGEATVRLANNKLTGIDGSGELKDVVVNDTPVGSGFWEAHSAGDQITGTLQVGELARYVKVDNFAYNTRTEAIKGDLDLYNIQLQDLVAISRRYLPTDLLFDARQTLNFVTGQVSMASSFSGTIKSPNVVVPTLHVDNIKVRDANFQSLDADFDRTNQVWTVRNVTLLGDPTPTSGVGRIGQAKYYVHDGVIDEHGAMDVSADLTNIGLAELASLLPWFTGKSGQANLYLNATGPTRSPAIHGTLEARGLLAELDKKLLQDVAQAEAAGGLTEEQRTRFYDKTLSVNTVIDLSEGADKDKGLKVEGNYSYSGFKGGLEANAGFGYPFKILPDQPASGTITLQQRSLAEIAKLIDVLDPRTVGTIAGKITAEGTPSNLIPSGSVVIKAETMAFDVMDEPAKDVLATLSLAPHLLTFQASGKSLRGGSLTAQLTTPIADIENFAETVQTGLLDNLLNNSLAGSVKVDGLALRQTLLPNPDARSNAGSGLIAGVFTGDFSIAGTVAQPLIKGTTTLSKSEVKIPTIEVGNTDREPPTINPHFDITATLADPVRIQSASMDLYLLGNAKMGGSLQYPQADSTMYVDHGSIRLPGGNVRLEQGGTVVLRYSASPLNVLSSLTVDLEGRTALSAPLYGDILERYEVVLGIRGDLLRENALSLTASSDPPGLSQQRILSMLGQTELLSSVSTGLFSGGFAGSTERQLRGALMGFALPMIFDPVTRGLAQGLGLDYLSLEYNQYEQASIVFARPLGRGWSLQGRRQITPAPPGFLQQYDIRLVYRPRRLPGVLNRLSFSIGADELRPWKISIEYGTRF